MRKRGCLEFQLASCRYRRTKFFKFSFKHCELFKLNTVLNPSNLEILEKEDPFYLPKISSLQEVGNDLKGFFQFKLTVCQVAKWEFDKFEFE